MLSMPRIVRPDPSSILGRNLVPPLGRQPCRSIKRNKELLMPGKDPGGCIITILLGIAGAFVGTWIGRLVTGNETYSARWIMSIVGAMILLLLYRLIFRRRM